jgi:flagellar hook protein FlgE
VRGASGSTPNRGGINPAQVGLGMTVAGIDQIGTQGNLQSTGKRTDLGIQGDGYFVVTNGSQTYYTRDGSFDLTTDGTLVSPSNGLRVMGWNGVNGVVDTSGITQPIRIPLGEGVIGQVTTGVNLKGNVNRDATVPYATTVSTFDSTGGQHKITLTFTKTGPNAWSVAAVPADSVTTVSAPTVTGITFDGTTGKLATPALPPSTTITVTPDVASGAAAFDVAVDLSGLSQLASANEVTSLGDGAAAGSLVSFNIGAGGEITGVYSNGLNRPLGQIAMAIFPNSAALMKAGGNLLTVSPNSGEAQVAAADTGGRGTMSSGFLEMSNVDLALQFTSMIVAQRGFQANARIITASDEMLQELVSLKR